jgi:hypothetical protein
VTEPGRAAASDVGLFIPRWCRPRLAVLHGEQPRQRECSDCEHFGVHPFPSPLPRHRTAGDVTQKALEPLGCLADLGWYTVRISLWAFNFELPSHVRATHWRMRGELPVEFDATLYWDDGRCVRLCGPHARSCLLQLRRVVAVVCSVLWRVRSNRTARLCFWCGGGVVVVAVWWCGVV